MRRLDTRVERLEAMAPRDPGVPSAVVRYNPGNAKGWLPSVFAQLGWPASLVALVTIDGDADVDAAPQVLVPPIAEGLLSTAQRSVLAQAGKRPGAWWIAIAGCGWADAIPMPNGEGALLADLRKERQREHWGQAGEF